MQTQRREDAFCPLVNLASTCPRGEQRKLKWTIRHQYRKPAAAERGAMARFLSLQLMIQLLFFLSFFPPVPSRMHVVGNPGKAGWSGPHEGYALIVVWQLQVTFDSRGAEISSYAPVARRAVSDELSSRSRAEGWAAQALLLLPTGPLTRMDRIVQDRVEKKKKDGSNVGCHVVRR